MGPKPKVVLHRVASEGEPQPKSGNAPRKVRPNPKIAMPFTNPSQE
jgi:hypothetical protein